MLSRRSLIVLVTIFLFCLRDLTIKFTGSHLEEEELSTLITKKISTGEKPLAIIHVGPRKTATSTIQTYLESVQGELSNLDNFEVVRFKNPHYKKIRNAVLLCMDKCKGKVALQCIDSCRSNEDIREALYDFKTYLSEKAAEGKHILLSDEGITRMTERAKWVSYALREMFAAYERTRVVANYRRYYDFVMSEYNQQGKPYVGNAPKKIQIKDASPGFCEWYRHSRRGKKGKLFAPLSKKLRDEWQSTFGTVQFFNLHEPTRSNNVSLAHRWLCEVAPEANHTCAMAVAGKFPPPLNTNESFSSLEALRILQSASHKGLIHNVTEVLLETVVSLQSHLESLENPPPLECLSDDELDTFLEKSLQMEQTIVPEYFKGGGQRALRASFEEKVKGGAFCNIDVDRLLKDPAWIDYFFTFGS